MLRERSPNMTLNRNSGKVGTPPLPLPVGPGEQGILHEGELFRLVLCNLPFVDLGMYVHTVCTFIRKAKDTSIKPSDQHDDDVLANRKDWEIPDKRTTRQRTGTAKDKN